MNKAITWLAPDGDREWFPPLDQVLEQRECRLGPFLVPEIQQVELVVRLAAQEQPALSGPVDLVESTGSIAAW